MKTEPEKEIDKLMKEMENDKWYVKLRRYINLQYWMLYCYIFNRPKKHRYF